MRALPGHCPDGRGAGGRVQNQEISIRYGVQSIPTLMVFKGGKMVERVLGAMPKPRLVSLIQPHLA